jgi:hypothetical protein
MMSFVDRFRVEPGQRVDLDEFDADFKPKGIDRDEAEDRFRDMRDELRDLQHVMYA